MKCSFSSDSTLSLIESSVSVVSPDHLCDQVERTLVTSYVCYYQVSCGAHSM